MSRAGWAVVASAANPGAIGIIEIQGDVVATLHALSGRRDWPVGRVRLVPLGDIDDGLVTRTADDRATLMPHGGMRVVQRLAVWLTAHGLERRTPAQVPATLVYPEARDDVEALMLATLARAASPLAIDLLLDQPRRWRDPTLAEVDPACARRLDRLVDPPDVVLVGPPDVGKSTLSNALLGRRLSIPLDGPGTTRDYTTGRVDLDGLVVRWHDTPGLRATSHPVETRAMALAETLLARADLVIAITDTEHDWPRLDREPALRVSTKQDLGRRSDADLALSAVSGAGMAGFVTAVRDHLVPPSDRGNSGRWRFSDGLSRARE